MKKIVVLTGAGMSAESGLSTFRDAGGLWEQYAVEDVATPEGFARDPELVINFYNERRRQLADVSPCRGHDLLAQLEKDFEVTVITQNVDDLHERAGSTDVIHLHGELTKVTSSRNPNDPKCIRTLEPGEWRVRIGDKAADGSQLRPYIVWFGEPVPTIGHAAEVTSRADVFIVIGTSLNVYPAAGLLHYVPAGAPVFLIDPQPVQVPSGCMVKHLMKGASEGLEELMPLLKK